MRTHKLAIKDIYVPVKRRSTLNPKTMHDIAESILEVGLQCPILVRQDGARFVQLGQTDRRDGRVGRLQRGVHECARTFGIIAEGHVELLRAGDGGDFRRQRSLLVVDLKFEIVS